MKIITICFFAILLLSSCKDKQKDAPETESIEAVEEPTTAEPSKKKPLSPHTAAMAMIGDAHIHFDYSSPGVRERVIFGGLLPYDAVWQAGAHRATWMETNKDLSIAGKTLKAGKYGFFVIPNQEEWTVIFNSNWDQHGKDDYNEKDDVLRFTVIPQISDESTEHLTYTVSKDTDNSGTIKLAWEKVAIQFPFQIE